MLPSNELCMQEDAGIPLHNYTVYKELMNASLIVTRYTAKIT